MKSCMVCLLFALSSLLFPSFVPAENADIVAKNFIVYNGWTSAVGGRTEIRDGNENLLAYSYNLIPCGFEVVCADDGIVPVIVFDKFNSFDADSPLASMIKADLTLRLKYIDRQDESSKSVIRDKWTTLLNTDISKAKVELWPPEGTTTTGGWTETKWTQNSPYNLMCPMDLSSSQRSLTGCPATAMSQVLFYHKLLNGTRFSSGDRYYHNYTQSFWIDDAARAYDFPYFEKLNLYLDSIEIKFAAKEDLTDNEKAALNFACGTATKSVYSSSGSGTFGVDQAYDAYQRFGFSGSVLLLGTTYTDKEIKTKMAENIKESLPVHLAVVDPGWSYGHNVVCDGYRDDDYFRINFGWGGSYDGWYSLPEGFPYSMTVFEGIVADIRNGTGIDEEPVNIANDFELYQNYPNPFNGSTTISFSLKRNSIVHLNITSAKGEFVKTLFSGILSKGIHNCEFGSDELESGIYFYNLSFNGNPAETKRMLYLK